MATPYKTIYVLRHGEKANEGSAILTQVIYNLQNDLPIDTVVAALFPAGSLTKANIPNLKATFDVNGGSVGSGYTTNANGITVLTKDVSTAADIAGLTQQGGIRANKLSEFVNNNLGLPDRSYNFLTYSSDAKYGEPESRTSYTGQTLKPKSRTILRTSDALSADGFVARLQAGPAGNYVVIAKHTSSGILDVVNGLISGIAPGTQASGTGAILAPGSVVPGTVNTVYPTPIPALVAGSARGTYTTSTNSDGTIKYAFTAAGSTTVQSPAFLELSKEVQAAIPVNATPVTTIISGNDISLGGKTLNSDNNPFDYYTNLTTGKAAPTTGSYSLGDTILGPQLYDTYAQYSKNYTTAYLLDETGNPFQEEIEYPLVFKITLDSDNIATSATVNLGYEISSDVSDALIAAGYVNVPGYNGNVNNTNNSLVNTPASSFTVKNYYNGTTPLVSVNLLATQPSFSTINASGDNILNLYVNGQLILQGTDWHQVQSTQGSLHTGDVIAVSVANTGGPAGLLASFNFANSTFVTNSLWKCINAASVTGSSWTAKSYDDSKWAAAYQQADNSGAPSVWISSNGGQPLAGIPSNANWLWFEDSTHYPDNDSSSAYFRYTLPSTNSTPATIVATGDNILNLYLNGTQISSGNDWQQTETVSLILKAGDVIAASVANTGGPAALLASITLGNGTVYSTDSPLWKVANAANVTNTSWKTMGDTAFTAVPASGFQGPNSGPDVWFSTHGQFSNVPASAQYIWFEDTNNYPLTDTSVAYFLFTVPA